MRENLSSGVCEQHRRRPACASAQSDQRLCNLRFAHPRSLISAFAIRVLEITIYKLTTIEILVFYLVSVADETGFSLALLETPKTGFVAMRPIYWVPYTLNSPRGPQN